MHIKLYILSAVLTVTILYLTCAFLTLKNALLPTVLTILSLSIRDLFVGVSCRRKWCLAVSYDNSKVGLSANSSYTSLPLSTAELLSELWLVLLSRHCSAS